MGCGRLRAFHAPRVRSKRLTNDRARINNSIPLAKFRTFVVKKLARLGLARTNNAPIWSDKNPPLPTKEILFLWFCLEHPFSTFRLTMMPNGVISLENNSFMLHVSCCVLDADANPKFISTKCRRRQLRISWYEHTGGEISNHHRSAGERFYKMIQLKRISLTTLFKKLYCT